MSTPERHGITPAARGQRGLSIIELMVGIVIALLIGLTAMSSANFFTAAQRASVGAGTASVSIAAARASIKADVAQAGLGFFGNSQYSCGKLNLSAKATAFKDGSEFSPLQVTRDTDDQLEIIYGSQVESGSAVLLKGPTTSDGTAAKLASYLPTSAGQAVLLIPATSADPCTVRSVTEVTPAAAGAPQSLSFGGAGAHNQVAFGTKVSYDTGSTIASLGSLQWRRYKVAGGNLVLEQPLDADPAADPPVLVRDVVAFRVQYGVADSPAGTTLANWVEPTGAWSSLNDGNISQVRAVGIGVVARSPQKEKRDPKTGQCTASSGIPQPFADDVTLPPDDERRCWRYRKMNVVVPLRNIVLGRTG